MSFQWSLIPLKKVPQATLIGILKHDKCFIRFLERPVVFQKVLLVYPPRNVVLEIDI